MLREEKKNQKFPGKTRNTHDTWAKYYNDIILYMIYYNILYYLSRTVEFYIV